ncbi:hypothetical protein L211DRAFT_837532 [Terfezia boudieri ATCC MYA-4762]|uniref:Uncharacterized protein n=1 Tax=Terfezia boudieri ATCC MYA-4762 TaxID=1051890 RepID=A0A3N4LTQ2_9PEZI|nr:hypothetical protein L211DRAFT_837532 [Terfezia boudieri ATCC MYA-4762]
MYHKVPLLGAGSWQLVTILPACGPGYHSKQMVDIGSLFHNLTIPPFSCSTTEQSFSCAYFTLHAAAAPVEWSP